MASESSDSLLVKILSKVNAPPVPDHAVQNLVNKLTVALASERDAAATTVTQLNTQLNQLRTQNGNLQTQIAANNTGQQAASASTNAHDAASQAEITSLKEEIHKLKTNNGNLNSTINRVNAWLKEAPSNNAKVVHAKVQGLRSMIGNVFENAHRLQQWIDAAEKARNRATSEMDRLRTVNKSLNANIKSLQRQLEQPAVNARSLPPTGTFAPPVTVTATQAPQRDLATFDTGAGTEGLQSANATRPRFRLPSVSTFGSRWATLDPRGQSDSFSIARPNFFVSEVQVQTPEGSKSGEKRCSSAGVDFNASPLPFDPRVVHCTPLASTHKRSASDGLNGTAAKKVKIEQQDDTDIPTIRAPRCRKCHNSGLRCDGEAPCSNCEAHMQVCLYLPCRFGLYCVEPGCGYIHGDQANPWDTRSPGGNGTDKFLQLLHKQIKLTNNVVANSGRAVQASADEAAS